MPDGHLRHTPGGYGIPLRREKNKKERVRDDLTPFLEEPACPTKNRYRVVVGGLGIVFEDYSKLEAKRQFNQFVIQSKTARAAPAGKSVTLFKNYEIIGEYYPPARE